MKQYQLIGPFRELLPMNGLARKGALNEEKLPVLRDAGILLAGETIHRVGPWQDLLGEAKALDASIQKLEGAYVGLPGLIDAHTHLCFGGSRAMDYAARNAGKSYLEIAKAGGGIWSSVRHTRAASQSELETGIQQRALRHLREGVTTIEVKSGYGLNVADELKMLRAIRAVDQLVPTDLVPTCLATHIVPKDFTGGEAAYVDYLLAELFPQIQAEELCQRVDIFIEETAFSPGVSERYLRAVKAQGFSISVHADQFHPGGSAVAIAVGAMTADHLEVSGEREIAALAKSEVIPVALPGASLGIGCAFTPARKLLDAGCSLVIASDWNPGSAPMGDLLLQAAVLGAYEKLNTAEVFAALTFRAAAALGLNDRGKLTAGQKADIIAFPCTDHREILYHQGKLKPSIVWKNGRTVQDE